MDVARENHSPPPPPTNPHIAPLLQTNRQILEQMRAMQEETRSVRNFALEMEDHRAARRAAEAHEDRARHEETMHLFRSVLNPHAQAIEAMHAGAASLHQAAQDVSTSAHHHRAMAATSADLFATAIRQGIEALRPVEVSSGGGPPPPPPGGGAVHRTAAQRPDEMAFAGPEVVPTIIALDEGMSSGKRAVSPIAEVEASAKRTMRRATSAAASGAARAASASAAPASKEEERPAAPGYQPEARETEKTVKPYGKATGRPKERIHPIAKSVRGRSTAPRIIALDEQDTSGGRVILPIVGGDRREESTATARYDSRLRRKSPRSRSSTRPTIVTVR